MLTSLIAALFTLFAFASLYVVAVSLLQARSTWQKVAREFAELDKSPPAIVASQVETLRLVKSRRALNAANCDFDFSPIPAAA